jgi:hypothetical protein
MATQSPEPGDKKDNTIWRMVLFFKSFSLMMMPRPPIGNYLCQQHEVAPTSSHQEEGRSTGSLE